MSSEKVFKILFPTGSGICVGDAYSTKVERVPSISSRTEFYCINPLDPEIDHGYTLKEKYSVSKPRRADINVFLFKNFIFEMDSVDLPSQLDILEKTGIPFTAITYSGSKSYHAVLSLETPLDFIPHTNESISAYKNIWTQISGLINKTARDMGHVVDVVDSSCKNPSRLTRVPGSIRNNEKEQKLMSVGSEISESDFNDLIQRCPPIFKRVMPVDSNKEIEYDIETVEEFFDACPQGLYVELKYVDWALPEGNYPRLLRLTLWAIDSTSVSKSIYLEALEEAVFPKFRKMNYPKSKWSTAIDHAYNIKGAY